MEDAQRRITGSKTLDCVDRDAPAIHQVPPGRDSEIVRRLAIRVSGTYDGVSVHLHGVDDWRLHGREKHGITLD